MKGVQFTLHEYWAVTVAIIISSDNYGLMCAM